MMTNRQFCSVIIFYSTILISTNYMELKDKDKKGTKIIKELNIILDVPKY